MYAWPFRIESKYQDGRMELKNEGDETRLTRSSSSLFHSIPSFHSNSQSKQAEEKHERDVRAAQSKDQVERKAFAALSFECLSKPDASSLPFRFSRKKKASSRVVNGGRV